jgi:hypothetical protein
MKLSFYVKIMEDKEVTEEVAEEKVVPSKRDERVKHVTEASFKVARSRVSAVSLDPDTWHSTGDT